MLGMDEMNKRTNHSGPASNRELIKATYVARGVLLATVVGSGHGHGALMGAPD